MRKALFWLHLTGGVTAGALILLMSATGVLLTYEKQMLAWSDRTSAAAPPSTDARRLPVSAWLAAARAADPSAPPGTVSIASVAGAPALVTVGQRTLAINAYTGAVIGDASPRLRRFFRGVTSWHRWLGVEGPGRQVARVFTGWGNAVFLLIVVGGPILWIPRKWTAAQVRAIAFFKAGLRGKPRDFNWHNVIGIWSCVPLLLIVVTALPMSFSWANEGLYRMVGEVPPPPGPGPQAPARGAAAARTDATRAVVARELEGARLDEMWMRAERHVEGWRTISLRVPAGAAGPVAFTIDRGAGGQPQLRGTLTFDPTTGTMARWEPFDTQTMGRRLRSFARFAHTGEFFGVAGQTIAGLASGGAVVLTWTGLALAVRRLNAFGKRRRDARAPDVARTNAA